MSWEEVSLSVSFGSEREEDLARELFATVALALAKGRAGVVLLLDEAQLIHDERDRHGEHPLCERIDRRVPRSRFRARVQQANDPLDDAIDGRSTAQRQCR